MITGPSLTVRRADLGALQPLGKGGTAIVYRAGDYRIPGVMDVVYKEYKPSTRRYAGPALINSLLPLVRFRDKLDPKLRQQWDERVIWPLRVVVGDDEHAAVGILMPLIRPQFFQRVTARSGAVTNPPREIDLLFGSPADLQRIGIPAVDARTRLTLIARIAGVYAMMHRAGVVIGDISARNIVYDPSPVAPSVLVVDADSARIKGSRAAFSSQPHTPHWEPPEALAAVRALEAGRQDGTSPSQLARLRNTAAVQNTATDVYKFALIVIRTLDPGRGRAIARDPTRAIAVLRRTGATPAAELLRRSCAEVPPERPSMRDWYLALTGRPPEATPTSKRPPRIQSGLRDGQQNGNWVYVEGKGWSRRAPTPEAP